MKGGTTSREGKEQAFASCVSRSWTAGDSEQTSYCVCARRGHCEKLVWCEGKDIKANSRYDS